MGGKGYNNGGFGVHREVRSAALKTLIECKLKQAIQRAGIGNKQIGNADSVGAV